MDSTREARSYEFEGFRLDAAQRRLTRADGAHVELPSRAFDLLLHMVERPGDLLEKSALLKAVWPTTVVEESNLSQSIFLLRRALGDSTNEHRFIVTVPGRGYQFVARVRDLGAQPDAGVQTATQSSRAWPGTSVERRKSTGSRRLRWWHGGAALAAVAAAIGAAWWLMSAGTASRPEALRASMSTAPHAIAVLPFTDLSPEHDMDYFADGIAEEITNSLSRVKSLRVVGRRSAFAFRGDEVDAHTIGQKLNVDSILEGSVRKDGNRIRVSAQLVRTRDDIGLWSSSYDRTLDDILDIQGDIAAHVAAALSPFIESVQDADGSPVLTRNTDAYTAYLRGVYLFRDNTFAAFPRARDEFLKAVRLDPDFALAHAWLARCYAGIARASLDDVAKNRALAAASLDRALELDPQLANLWWVRTWPGNLDTMSLTLRAKNLEQALEANPNDAEAMLPVAFVYMRLGRRAEALDLYERARRSDPLWPNSIMSDAATSYAFRLDEPRSLALAAEVEWIAPGDARPAALRALMAFNQGQALDWDRWTAKMIDVAPRDQPAHGYLSLDYGHLGMLDAAMYHAKLCGSLNPRSAAMHFNIAHINMFAGNVEAARPVVREAMTKFPEDFLAQLAQGEQQYFSGDCAGAIQSIQQARPAYAQAAGALDLMTDPEHVPILAWCLRQQGNSERARQLYDSFFLQHQPPSAPGFFDGHLARMAAAVGDRQALVKHLRALVDTRSMQFAFARHEPMIQPYRDDPEVSALLGKLEAHKAEWRRVIPKSSMRVPVPPAPEPARS